MHIFHVKLRVIFFGFIFSGKFLGGFNTYSPALRQPKFYLIRQLQQPSLYSGNLQLPPECRSLNLAAEQLIAYFKFFIWETLLNIEVA